jgi:hypothetical protein
MAFGMYGKEEGALVTTSRAGVLKIQLLLRTANLEPPSAEAAVPPEQDIPIQIPKKSALFFEQQKAEIEAAPGVREEGGKEKEREEMEENKKKWRASQRARDSIFDSLIIFFLLLLLLLLLFFFTIPSHVSDLPKRPRAHSTGDDPCVCPSSFVWWWELDTR